MKIVSLPFFYVRPIVRDKGERYEAQPACDGLARHFAR